MATAADRDRTNRTPLGPSVTPEYIIEQRANGWPDIHPEDYCHQCGRPNPVWYSPEFPKLVGSHSGILCPPCLAALDTNPTTVWCFTRATDDRNQQARLTDILNSCLADPDPADAHRIAGCITQAGWRQTEAEVPCDWDQESYCVTDGCPNPATHRRLTGLAHDTPIYELECCECSTHD